jgi:tetratricopeptide (TPR) repeat protein
MTRNNAELGDVNKRIKEALALAHDDPRKAIDILKKGAQEATRCGDKQGASSMSKHAGVLCAELGDVAEAASYYQQAVSGAPDDPYLYFALGDILRRLRRFDEARRSFVRCLELAAEQQDVEMVTMVQEAQKGLDDVGAE